MTNEFGFKFEVGDVVYHICDNDKIYRYLVCIQKLSADKSGVSRYYVCQSLDGAAGLFVAGNDSGTLLQEWELTK